MRMSEKALYLIDSMVTLSGDRYSNGHGGCSSVQGDSMDATSETAMWIKTMNRQEKEDQAQLEYLRRWKREETEEKESVRKTEKERYEMKYKVGDKVRVRSDFKNTVLYGGLYAVDEMLKKKIVTITSVHDDYYKVVEDDYKWTDGMLEGLVEDELTAEEAIRIQAEMCSVPCRKCPISKKKRCL